MPLQLAPQAPQSPSEQTKKTTRLAASLWMIIVLGIYLNITVFCSVAVET